MFRKYSAAESVSSHIRGGGVALVGRGPRARGVVVPAAAAAAAAISGHVDRGTWPGVVVRAGIARRDKRQEETAAALHEIVFLAPCRRRTPPYPSRYHRRRRLSPSLPHLRSRIVLWA